MKDAECKIHTKTYKCDEESCENCPNRLIQERGFVIKKKDSNAYHVNRTEITNYLPYAAIYDAKEMAQFDLMDGRNQVEWEIREIEVTYVLK